MAEHESRLVGRRSLLGAAAVAVLGAGSLAVPAGCAASPAGRTPSPAASGTLAERLRTALAARDEASFAAAFTGRAAALAPAWYQTWSRLAEVTLADADGGLDVAWRVAAEPGKTRVRLTLSLVDGQVDAVADASPEPVWLRRAAEVATDGPLGILTATGDAGAWLDAARTAAGRVAAAGVERWGWPGDLVVELAADAGALRRRAGGADPGTAVAYTTRDVGPVVVVDGAATAGWAAEDRAGLLTHEGVHVAHGTGRDRCPRWVSEGFAEWVAAPVWPAAAAANAAALAAVPVDAGLPADEEFTDAAAAPGAYARAELAVAALVAAHGRDAIVAAMADWTASGLTAADAAALLRAERTRRG